MSKKIIFDCPPSLRQFMELHCKKSGQSRAEFIRFCIRFYINSLTTGEYTEENLQHIITKLSESDILEMHRTKGPEQ